LVRDLTKKKIRPELLGSSHLFNNRPAIAGGSSGAGGDANGRITEERSSIATNRVQIKRTSSMAVVIAGERSGAGKTTIALSLLAYLQRQGSSVQSFKVGPDYIDPMFHEYVTGRPCRNLDPVLTSPDYVCRCFDRHVPAVEFALVEGVMGLFDGVNAPDGDRPEGDFASTAHIARLLDLPVVLTVDCARLSGSVAAIAHGYCHFDPRVKIAGVILNRVASDRHCELLENALEPLGLPILGILRRQDAIAIPDRHLGLVPTAELPDLDALFDRLAHLAARSFNWDLLFPLLQVARTPRGDCPALAEIAESARVTIAVARDRAFSFYYPDNLDRLRDAGAELVSWSPLADDRLPEGTNGLYFGGGFPEIFAESLAANDRLRDLVRGAIAAGMPTYAECGGLMYLCEHLVDFDGQSWPMVGILPTTAQMGSRLNLGYRKAIALQPTPILAKGETVCAHEFHRSHLTREPHSPIFQKSRYDRPQPLGDEGWHGTSQTLHASYLHLHWGDRSEIPARFVSHCADFARSEAFAALQRLR